ncbi:MAG: hypothetical protein OEZ22_01095 [Spirochaetia bacterium]|nr:hypothetical protein [Spirochaetia bacterium]
MIRKTSAIVLIYFFYTSNVFSQEIKNFSGKLDNKGQAKIEYKLSNDKVFFLQAFIFYKKNWRPVSVFFNDSQLWIDIGPSFKDADYKINLLIKN